MVNLQSIENSSIDELERTKIALSINEVLSPLECVLAMINPKIYYQIFKVVNRGKVRRLKELEENFSECPMDLF